MNSRRELPSVDQVLRDLAADLSALDRFPRELVRDEARMVLAERRKALTANAEAVELSVADEVRARLMQVFAPGLRRIINATGVVLHTNLGRAPLPLLEPLSGYSNLEYDLATGKRGKREAHVLPLLNRVLGKPSVMVNNNAAAVFLVLNEIANGGEVIVSRGELIEIGDGFRIPEIMMRSGASLREVGTTNRTRIEDYEHAITDRTRLILRVHRSNFHMSGFTARPTLADLAGVGAKCGVPIYEDLGSGCLADLRAAGIQEPAVQESLAGGANLVSFSCDKLLGGPQAGIIAGNAELIARIRRNPVYRALRVDKLILQALETTLRHTLRRDWASIPALRMIFTPLPEMRARAERLILQLRGTDAEIREAESPIGGGSTPDQVLPTCVIELSVGNASEFAQKLRQATVPVIARIERERIVLDMRTVFTEDEDDLIAALLLVVRSVS